MFLITSGFHMFKIFFWWIISNIYTFNPTGIQFRVLVNWDIISLQIVVMTLFAKCTIISPSDFHLSNTHLYCNILSFSFFHCSLRYSYIKSDHFKLVSWIQKACDMYSASPFTMWNLENFLPPLCLCKMEMTSVSTSYVRLAWKFSEVWCLVQSKYSRVWAVIVMCRVQCR